MFGTNSQIQLLFHNHNFSQQNNILFTIDLNLFYILFFFVCHLLFVLKLYAVIKSWFGAKQKRYTINKWTAKSKTYQSFQHRSYKSDNKINRNERKKHQRMWMKCHNFSYETIFHVTCNCLQKIVLNCYGNFSSPFLAAAGRSYYHTFCWRRWSC